ncbi:hypothetical protein M422DRAFT_34309 [Sphaerobolus stellatus SS14]|uniref:MYND-type domain-containing protein n=1 Tax=Sphaerobolus stellatus (strain SS14) TaxID=990650 RepID=A0A0C9VG40_SPHS4|nr:hypothetical protein M422DRAFT_34309 [Sphaerobolus stellatus SS14]
MSEGNGQGQLGQRLRTASGAATAVSILRQNPNDYQLLNALANLTADPECWEYLCGAGVVDLFIDLILKTPDRTRNESDEFPLWLVPLQGLFNAMVGMQRSPQQFQDKDNRETLLHILKNAPSICGHIHKDKTGVCATQPSADNVRRSLISWIQAMWNGGPMINETGSRSELKAQHIIDLATWSWIYSVSADVRSRAAIALADVLDQPNSSKEDLDQVVIAADSRAKLVLKMNAVLDDEDLLEDSLANNLSLLVGFTGQTVHLELAREFAELKTHKHVISCLRRQLKHSDLDTETWRIIEYSGMLTVNIVNEAASPTEDLTKLIDSSSLIPLLGGILLRSVQEKKTTASWMSMVSLLKHTCTCTSKTCRVRTSPAYMSALRTHLSWRWWPTLRKLASVKSEESSKIQKEWIALGALAGLNENIEREKHESGKGVQGCWRVECVDLVHPSDPAKNPQLQKCSACKKALYCSTACQTSDWKEHKKKCKEWKPTASST